MSGEERAAEILMEVARQMRRKSESSRELWARQAYNRVASMIVTEAQKLLLHGLGVELK